MTYPYPTDLSIITQLLIDKITTAAATFDTPVQLPVFYGDQNRIPKTPMVCIEPANKVRTLAGVPNMTENEYEVLIIVYGNKVQEMQTTRKQVDHLAFQIEFLIHQDLQLKNGGPTPNMIHGYVRQSESGYAWKGNTLYRTNRLTWYGKNKTSLPVA